MKYPLMRQNIQREDLDNVIELLKQDDPKLTAGPRVNEFEEQWSQWLGVKYSIFVNSGSSSNLLAIAWLKEQYPEGGRVIVPPLTWSSDIASVLWMGFKPVFVDIKLETLAIDEDLLEDTLKKYNDIKAVFLTHAQGINGLTEKIVSLCQDNGINLIEDVCESHGVKLFNNNKAGSEGIISCFSFYYAHHISTIEGGMVCTNYDEINELLLMIRSHGWDRDLDDNSKDILRSNNRVDDFSAQFAFYLPGLNVRSTDLQAVIGLRQVDKIDKFSAARNKNFKLYQELLDDEDSLLDIIDREDCFISSFCYPIVSYDRDKIVKRLRDNGVECRPLIAGSMTMSPMWRKFGTGHTNIPVSTMINKYGFYVPNHQGMTEEDVRNIVKLIKE